MKKILVLIGTFIHFAAHPNVPTFGTLSKSIKQHDPIKFQSEYNTVVVPLNLKKKLRRLAMDEEVHVLELMSEKEEQFSQILNTSGGALCLLGSVLALSPLILNTTLCIDERTMKYWHNPPWLIKALLYSIYKTAQWCDAPTAHHPDAIERFFGTHVLSLYLVSASSGILLAYIGGIKIKKALTSKKSLETKLKNTRQIVRMISDSINEG